MWKKDKTKRPNKIYIGYNQVATISAATAVPYKAPGIHSFHCLMKCRTVAFKRGRKRRAGGGLRDMR